MTFRVSESAAPTAPALPVFLKRAWRSSSLTRLASLVLFAALVAWVLAVFRDYGISNDEPVQHTYGQLLWAWYESGFSDTRAFHYINLYLYGGLFDLIAAGLDGHVPLETYELRHLLSASFGLVGLLGVWRLGRLLGGEKVGIAASVLLAFTGMYGGAMFTHTKDVPFAAAMVWSLYFTTLVAHRLPELPSWRTVAGLGLAVGCALGLRVGGVFAVLYLGVTMAAGALLLGDIRLFGRLVLRLLPAGALAYAVMAVTWPWSVMPPTNLFTAMGTFSNFGFDLKTLINGREVLIDQVPGTYMSEYLLIKLPEVTLLGLFVAIPFALAFVGSGLRRGGADWRWRLVLVLPLALSLAVPVAFTLLDHPPLYNGIRHFLFVLPSASLIAALGLKAGWRWMLSRSAPLGFAFASIALGLFLFNATNFVRLHPFEYVSYNQLVGGVAGAAGRFEGDYWSTSLRQAALELRRGIEQEPNPTGKPYEVAICAEDQQVKDLLGPRLELIDDWDKADFLLTATNIGCDNLVPGMTYRTISRLGVPLAMVVDMRARHEPVIEPLPWDDDENPETPPVAFDGPGSALVASRK
ncbi:glycosyltransferase family 39 protein [Bosea sp. 117]|uniref:ArnT family glycosyltransferase n=1 Tax=Bosea sp. 117 TaxID=1125973 RepID=UPI00068C7751|nr:glycosyltransferase family 39 protein [Bosea sp. 117]